MDASITDILHCPKVLVLPYNVLETEGFYIQYSYLLPDNQADMDMVMNDVNTISKTEGAMARATMLMQYCNAMLSSHDSTDESGNIFPAELRYIEHISQMNMKFRSEGKDLMEINISKLNEQQPVMSASKANREALDFKTLENFISEQESLLIPLHFNTPEDLIDNLYYIRRAAYSNNS